MSRWTQKFLLPAFTLALIAAGCDRQTALVPPEIHYGAETCADCGMIVGDPHYAAALAWRTVPGGSVQTADFDDIGCLLNWRRQHANVEILAAWVKDVRTAGWLEAASALYVQSQHLNTPMGSGVVAGASPNDFAALPVRQPVLTWAGLLKAKGPETSSVALTGHGGRAD